MGRGIKRVALDFDYPINKMIWKGYHNPYSGLKCGECDGFGSSKEYKKLSDDWYGFERPGNRWCYNITQDEVQALIDAGRLMDFTRVPIDEEQKKEVENKIKNGGNSWLPYNNGYIPTAEEVNSWAEKGMGHDGINQMICCKARAERLGITKIYCDICNGHGEIWPDEKYAKLCEEWKSIEPPEGKGYQLWSTTTKGTPLSPVFEMSKDLAKWLVDNNVSTFARQTATYEQWMKFIEGPGWSPSAFIKDGEIDAGVNM